MLIFIKTSLSDFEFFFYVRVDRRTDRHGNCD